MLNGFRFGFEIFWEGRIWFGFWFERKKLASGFDLDLDLSSLTGFGFDLDLRIWWICTPLERITFMTLDSIRLVCLVFYQGKYHFLLEQLSYCETQAALRLHESPSRDTIPTAQRPLGLQARGWRWPQMVIQQWALAQCLQEAESVKVGLVWLELFSSGFHHQWDIHATLSIKIKTMNEGIHCSWCCTVKSLFNDWIWPPWSLEKEIHCLEKWDPKTTKLHWCPPLISPVHCVRTWLITVEHKSC